MTTTPKPEPEKPKTRKTYTPSERAVRAVLALSLRDLNKFCVELGNTDDAVAKFVCEGLVEGQVG